MIALNLPNFEYKLKKINGKNFILDPLRKKFVKLTPEEWVRQSFVDYLIKYKNFPAGRISNECTIKLYSLSRRCDTVLYDKCLKPLIIVEYKAPNVKITEKVFNQIEAYNHELKAKYLIISNGLTHYCCKMDYDGMKHEYLKDIPSYEKL